MSTSRRVVKLQLLQDVSEVPYSNKAHTALIEHSQPITLAQGVRTQVQNSKVEIHESLQIANTAGRRIVSVVDPPTEASSTPEYKLSSSYVLLAPTTSK